MVEILYTEYVPGELSNEVRKLCTCLVNPETQWDYFSESHEENDYYNVCGIECFKTDSIPFYSKKF